MREPGRIADWIGLEEAIAQILSHVDPLTTEPVAIEAALGRVLADDVRSPVALPPWPNSAMDGFALRAADIAGASEERPVRLRVTESVPAGGFATGEVDTGEAIKIMTGAPLPAGADSVVRNEHTRETDGFVLVFADADAGRNIRPRGEDIGVNEVAVARGTMLRPGEIGLLASIGCASIPVHRRPVIAILSTGDELVAVSEFAQVRAGRRIVNSNSYALAAAVQAMGAEPLVLGIARDDPDDLRLHLQRGLSADALVTSAGASVGEHDLVKDVLDRLGVATDFWRVRIRPGSPFSFGRRGAVPVFGLPGNPVSALVTFEVLVKPALRRMLGRRALYSPVVTAQLGDAVSSRAGLTQFMRVRLAHSGDRLIARLTGPQGSGMLSSVAHADGLLVVPEDVDELPVGAPVRIVRLLAADDAMEEMGFETRMTQ